MPPVRPFRRRDRLGPYGDIRVALQYPAWEDTDYDARITTPVLYVARMAKEQPFWANFLPYIDLSWSHGYPTLYLAYKSTPVFFGLGQQWSANSFMHARDLMNG